MGRTHGGTHTVLHGRWKAMRTRCKNPHAVNYCNYGGKGIRVCPQWDESYETFRDWALSNGFQPHLTIERREVTKGYEPSNCWWAPRTVQAANRAKFKNGTHRRVGVVKFGERYQARIQVNGKRINLGMFDTEDDAGDTRNNYIAANNLPHNGG